MVSHLSAALRYLELFTEGQTLVNSDFLHPFWYVDRCGPGYNVLALSRRQYSAAVILVSGLLESPHFHEVPRTLGIRIMGQMSHSVQDTPALLILCVLTPCGSLK